MRELDIDDVRDLIARMQKEADLIRLCIELLMREAELIASSGVMHDDQRDLFQRAFDLLGDR